MPNPSLYPPVRPPATTAPAGGNVGATSSTDPWERPQAELVQGIAAAPTTPPLPPAEAGSTTSEYGAVKIFGIVSGTLLTLLTGAVAAHIISLSPAVLAYCGTALAAVNGAVVAIYAAARNYRKAGTPG
jgi:hypothetical protein